VKLGDITWAAFAEGGIKPQRRLQRHRGSCSATFLVSPSANAASCLVLNVSAVKLGDDTWVAFAEGGIKTSTAFTTPSR
jgi:hypothetical protein